MFSFASSATEATLRCTAAFIPSSAEVHDDFKRVLAYAGLSRHLSNDSANSDDLSNSESDETSDNNINILNKAILDHA